MKFYLNPPSVEPEDFPLSHLEAGDLGIITAVPDGKGLARPGDPVVGGFGQAVVIETTDANGLSINSEAMKGLRCRRLRRGEAATFTGE